MMTLDEAIEHAEWAANNCEGECSEEHRQLAEWLRELATLRAENEKLKKLLAQYGLFREVVGDPASEFASLRRRLHNLERENAKLREYSQWLEGMVEDGWWDPIVNVQKLFDDKRIELGIEVE